MRFASETSRVGEVMFSRANLAARLALVLGLGSAVVSAYWGSGGTWLLDTLGGTLEAAGRRGGIGVAVALWCVALVKVIAAVLPLLATRLMWHRRVLGALAWIQACVLTGYGLVLTGTGLLVQAGLVPSADPDPALAWHTYLWDPWFLAWGLLCIVALRGSRGTRPGAPMAVSTRNPDATVTAR
ncbi:MAG: DUF3995 domain-containing protein [Pseudonocardiales bacterium]